MRQRVEDPGQRQAIFEQVFSSLELPKVSIAQVADHVDHVRKVAGADHVGIGGDYDGASSWPEGLEDVSRYPHLFAELVRRGWSDGDLRKLAGENMLRVLREAEETGQRQPRQGILDGGDQDAKARGRDVHP